MFGISISYTPSLLPIVTCDDRAKQRINIDLAGEEFNLE